MKIIDKILYVKAIWFVIAGVFGICIGIQFYLSQPKTLKDLQTINGIITDIQYKDLFSDESKTIQNSIVIYINSVVSAYTYHSRHRTILDTAEMHIGDSCQVWVNVETRKYIKNKEIYKYKIRALNINSKQVIQFKRQGYLVVFIFLYSLIILVPALLLVVKHPDILFGKKEERENQKSIKEILKDCLQQLKIW